MKILAKTFSMLLCLSLSSLALGQSDSDYFDGPYVTGKSVQSFKSLVTLAQITMQDKVSLPKFTKLYMMINTKNTPRNCKTMDSIDLKDMLMRDISKRMDKAIWEAIPVLRKSAEDELVTLFNKSSNLQVCITGGRGQGYMEGHIDQTINIFVAKLTSQESNAAFNKREYDNLLLSFSAIDWEE